MRLLQLILSALALAVAVMLPAVSYAQLDAAAIARSQRDAMYGNGTQTGFGDNMYGDTGLMEGEEGEAVDSTETKKKRERRPLESYISATRCVHCPTGSGL